MWRSVLTSLFLTGLIPVAAGAQDVPEHQDTLAQWYGAYRSEGGDVLTLLAFGHGGERVRLLTDYTNGYRGPLVDGDGGRLVLASAEHDPFKKEVELVTRMDSSHRPTVTVLLEGREVYTGTQVPLSLEDVRFSSGDHELAGTVVRPTAVTGAPGVVFVHGSGPATRHDYFEWSYFFAAQGVVALMYDKQGAGESSGNWEEATFRDLAADATAAVRFLRAREGVDPNRVGLSGGSQGGWVAPLAAESLGDDIAYLIVTAGGPVTPREQERFRRLELVRARGVDASSLQTAERVLDCYFEFVGSLGERCGEDLQQHFKSFGEEPWYREDVGAPRSDPLANPWPEGRRRLARELDFDPRQLYASLTVPLLGVLGANEQTFPVDLAVERYESLVPSDLLTVQIVEDADHGLFVDSSPSHNRHQSPNAMYGMVSWVLEATASPTLPPGG